MITHAGLFVQAVAGGIAPVAMMVGIFAIFYFLMIMPQQRRQKKWAAMLETIKSGDRVTTSGGFKGTVLSLKDDGVVLRIPPDNVKIEVLRSSIVSLTTEEERS